MDGKDLEKLGFTKNEATVYLALLELGSVSVGAIVKRTGIHKVIIYDNLEKLVKRGLVHYVIKANKKHFEAQDPETLLRFLDEEQKLLKQKRKLAERLLPDLVAIKAFVKEKIEASIYKDEGGIKSVLEDILKQRKPILVFGAEGGFKILLGSYWKNWNLRREKAKINVKIIYNEKLRKKREKLEMKSIAVKFIPKEFESPATTFIYGDKVSIILWSKLPFAFLVQSMEIAKSYRSIFNLLWKLSAE